MTDKLELHQRIAELAEQKEIEIQETRKRLQEESELLKKEKAEIEIKQAELSAKEIEFQKAIAEAAEILLQEKLQENQRSVEAIRSQQEIELEKRVHELTAQIEAEKKASLMKLIEAERAKQELQKKVDELNMKKRAEDEATKIRLREEIEERKKRILQEQIATLEQRKKTEKEETKKKQLLEEIEKEKKRVASEKRSVSIVQTKSGDNLLLEEKKRLLQLEIEKEKKRQREADKRRILQSEIRKLREDQKKFETSKDIENLKQCVLRTNQLRDKSINKGARKLRNPKTSKLEQLKDVIIDKYQKFKISVQKPRKPCTSQSGANERQVPATTGLFGERAEETLQIKSSVETPKKKFPTIEAELLVCKIAETTFITSILTEVLPNNNVDLYALFPKENIITVMRKIFAVPLELLPTTKYNNFLLDVEISKELELAISKQREINVLRVIAYMSCNVITVLPDIAVQFVLSLLQTQPWVVNLFIRIPECSEIMKKIIVVACVSEPVLNALRPQIHNVLLSNKSCTKTFWMAVSLWLDSDAFIGSTQLLEKLAFPVTEKSNREDMLSLLDSLLPIDNVFKASHSLKESKGSTNRKISATWLTNQIALLHFLERYLNFLATTDLVEKNPSSGITYLKSHEESVLRYVLTLLSTFSFLFETKPANGRDLISKSPAISVSSLQKEVFMLSMKVLSIHIKLWLQYRVEKFEIWYYRNQWLSTLIPILQMAQNPIIIADVSLLCQIICVNDSPPSEDQHPLLSLDEFLIKVDESPTDQPSSFGVTSLIQFLQNKDLDTLPKPEVVPQAAKSKLTSAARESLSKKKARRTFESVCDYSGQF